MQSSKMSLKSARSPDRNHLQSGEQKTLSIHPVANGYPTLFRAGEGLGGKGRGDGYQTLHVMPSDTSGTFTAPTANWLWTYLYLYNKHH